jgi:hypothetical protein
MVVVSGKYGEKVLGAIVEVFKLWNDIKKTFSLGQWFSQCVSKTSSINANWDFVRKATSLSLLLT